MASSVNIVPDILKWWIQQVKKNVIFFSTGTFEEAANIFTLICFFQGELPKPPLEPQP